VRTAVRVFVLVASGAALYGQESLRLTLVEAEQLALANNPQLAASRYLARAAAEVPKELRGALLPTLAGAVTGTGAHSGSRIAAGALNNPVLYNRVGSGLAVTQTLYDFGRTRELAGSAELRAQAQDQLVNAARDALLLQVRRGFYAVLRATALVSVAEQTVRTRQLLYDQVETLAKNRLKSDLDVRFANVNLADARLLLSTNRNQLEASKAELVAAIGIGTPANLEVIETALPDEFIGSLEGRIRQAKRERPELRAMRLELGAAQRLVRAEGKLLYPTLGVVAATGLAPAGDEQVRRQYGAAALNLSIPIFNGWQFRARRAQADWRARAIERQMADLENRVERDVRLAWLSVQNAAERMQLTGQLLEQARLALDLAQGRYELGLSSIVEISQAQLNMTTAQISNTNARYDYQLQRATLEFQTAGLQ